jgi:hypothetical protein
MRPSLAHGKTIQQKLDDDPIIRARYDSAMGAMQDDRCFTSDWIVRGWDWAALGKATIVDLGGGIGTVSKALAKAFPLLEFVVQDRAEVIADAVVEDPEIKDRVRFMAHDIFAEQPFKNADVYLFRRVMMEKSDRECEDMLRALRPALKKGSYILVQDPMVRTAAASHDNRSTDLNSPSSEPRSRNLSTLARTKISRIRHALPGAGKHLASRLRSMGKHCQTSRSRLRISRRNNGERLQHSFRRDRMDWSGGDRVIKASFGIST